MSTSKVDSKKRITLPNSKPGDIYEIQHQADGRILLIRLEVPSQPRKMTREECLEAMQKNPLRPTVPWEALRKLTRED